MNYYVISCNFLLRIFCKAALFMAIVLERTPLSVIIYGCTLLYYLQLCAIYELF